MNALPELFDETPFDWPSNVDHVSASALKTFAACPEQYRRRYLQGVKIPPGAAAVWGSAHHDAIEFNYGRKIVTHVDEPVQDVADFYLSRVEERVEEIGGINELDWSGKFESVKIKGVEERKRVIGEVKERGEKLARDYRVNVSPSVQPVAVEKQFEVTVQGCPVPIIGYQDLIAETVRPPLADVMAEIYGDPAHQPNRRIIDNKTSAKRVNKPDPEWLFQSAVYQLADFLPHEWHVSVKGKEKMYVLTGADNDALVVKASPSRKRWVEMIVRSVVKELGWCYVEFGADEPWPATRALLHNWRCDYCGYEPTCPWRRG